MVVTNQITTRFVGAGFGAGTPLNSSEAFQDVDGADAEPEEDDGSHVTAALGNTWSHAVNTRLIVQYLDDKFREVKLRFCYLQVVIYLQMKEVTFSIVQGAYFMAMMTAPVAITLRNNKLN